MSALPSWVWPLAFVAVLAAMLWLSVRRVPQGNECVVERTGRYRRTLTAGTHYLLPLFDHAGPLIDIRETPLHMRTLKVVTRDEIEVEVALLCFVQITDAARATYEVRDVRAAVEELVATQVANHLAASPLGQLVTDRERALRELPERLDRATDVWGIKVTRLDIKDVRPPEQLLQAILDETRHEHQQRTRLLEAQGARSLEQEELQRAHQLQVQNIQHERELALATEASAMTLAVARSQAELDAEASRLQHAQAAAGYELVAARSRAEQQAELARIAAEEERTRASIAQEEQAARAALAWRDSLDRVQRQREEAAQQQRRIEQEAAHTHELARMAAEHAAHEARLQHALELERVNADRQAALGAIEHDKAMQAQRLGAERVRQELAFVTAQDALEQMRTLETSRVEAERAKNERELAARVRSAELVALEAGHVAHAREVAAQADARTVQLLSASLHGVNGPTLAYLAAREQADALRSLGNSSLSSVATGAAASLVANASATPPAMPVESADRSSNANGVLTGSSELPAAEETSAKSS